MGQLEMFGASAILPALVILLACYATAAAALVGLVIGFILLLRKRNAALVFLVPSVTYLSLLTYLLLPFNPHYPPPSIGVIDLRIGDNLKMIFDGGLRPYRLQGLESDCCVFDEATLTVIVPNGEPFTFKVDRASMNVLDKDQICSIDLFGLNTTVPEAVALTKRICQAWHLPPTGLDDAAAHLGTMPAAGKGWGSAFNQPKIRAWVTFQPLYYPPLISIHRVGGYVNVSFRLGQYDHGMKFLKGPIQPPPGYENVSMNPPPRVVAFPGIQTRIEVFTWGVVVLTLGLIGVGLFYILKLARNLAFRISIK